jgi:hypothetical protein
LGLKSRQRRTTGQRRLLPETGAWGFIIVSFLLLVVIYYGRDYHGIRLGFLGIYAWGLALSLAFALTLAYHALFMLPKRGEAGWREGLMLLLTYYYQQALRLLSGKKKPRATRPAPDAAYIPASFAKVRAGIAESHLATALTKGGVYTRADGPGYVKLNKGETVHELVDLRRHLRTMPVTVVTRDGIEIETAVIVIFQLKASPPEEAPLEQPYHYDEDAIFHALYGASVDAQQTARHWSERPAPVAASHLVATIATYTLDELIQPLDPQATPLVSIKSAVKQLTSAEMEAHGIEIVAVAVGQLKPPEDVTGERIKAWQAEWERQIQAEQAAGSAEALRRVQLAQARVQMEMIDSITGSIEMMSRQGDVDVSEVVTLRMIEILERAVSDDAIKALLPHHIINSLDQIQNWIIEPPRLTNQ